MSEKSCPRCRVSCQDEWHVGSRWVMPLIMGLLIGWTVAAFIIDQVILR